MATPYRFPQNNAVISSAGMGRESQEEMLRNMALLGNMGPGQAYAAGRVSQVWTPNGPQLVGGGMGNYGGSGGGYGGGLGDYLQDWNNQYQNARQSNENRYAAIRGGGPNLGGPAQVSGNAIDRWRAKRGGQTGNLPSDDQNAAMGGYLGRYQRNLGRLERLGAQEKADVTQRYDQQAAAGQQDLTSRGLSNSTVLGTMRLGNQREKSDALSRVNERLQGQITDADARLSGDQLQFMERRTDAYPDQNMLAQLAMRAGQAGVGAQNMMGGMGSPAAMYQYPMGMAQGFGNMMGGMPWGGYGGGMGGGGFRNTRNMNSSRYGRGPTREASGGYGGWANSSAYLPRGVGRSTDLGGGDYGGYGPGYDPSLAYTPTPTPVWGPSRGRPDVGTGVGPTAGGYGGGMTSGIWNPTGTRQPTHTADGTRLNF